MVIVNIILRAAFPFLPYKKIVITNNILHLYNILSYPRYFDNKTSNKAKKTCDLQIIYSSTYLFCKKFYH